MSLTRHTRGKTRPGRLRLLDPWFVQALPPGPVQVLDVGIGAEPDTTVELHRALLTSGREAHTLGTDVDADRVALLAAIDLAGLDAEHVGEGWRPRSAQHGIRAANLLRQYRLDSVDQVLERLGTWLTDGGLLVEGSTDRHGDRGVFRAFRSRGGQLIAEALVIVVEPSSRGFAPRALTPYLPRGLGWHGHPNPPVARFFSAWTEAFEQARAAGARSPAESFIGAAERLAARGQAVADPVGWRQGRMEVPAGEGCALDLRPFVHR